MFLCLLLTAGSAGWWELPICLACPSPPCTLLPGNTQTTGRQPVNRQTDRQRTENRQKIVRQPENIQKQKKDATKDVTKIDATKDVTKKDASKKNAAKKDARKKVYMKKDAMKNRCDLQKCKTHITERAFKNQFQSGLMKISFLEVVS